MSDEKRPPEGIQYSCQVAQLEKRSRNLYELCSFAMQKRGNEIFPCRNYLRDVYIEATGMEEFIDGCGAQKNELWYPFREAVAAVKMFSHLYYDLLHIEEATPYYSLLSIDGDFEGEIRENLCIIKETIYSSAETLIERAKACGLYKIEPDVSYDPCMEEEPSIRFPADRKTRHVEKPGKTVVYLATKVLNLAEEDDVREVLRIRNDDEYESHIPFRVNEEILRIVEARFHNLQSHYDTNIFESDIEYQDSNLKVLRGHISIIYHLLEIATHLAHYYERHMSGSRRMSDFEELRTPLEREVLLRILFEFVLNYSTRYLDASGQLCREMIWSYAEQGTIEVPIPNYRGFHVRPSTLIAKIVAHYGSKVRMVLDEQEYDAGFSLDLFRANEAINAYKRRYIAGVIEKLDAREKLKKMKKNSLRKGLQMLFLELMNKNEIIVYDTNIQFDEISPIKDESLGELACRFIKHYMSISKLDVHSDLTVTFMGDNRVLLDLKSLAENGYGEDKYGNNIVLPKDLVYLRR